MYNRSGSYIVRVLRSRMIWLMDLNKLRNFIANDFSDPALTVIKAVLTDVFFNTPGFNRESTGPLFSDHSDPLLSADLCNKLMHDDASFGSF